MVWSGLIIVMLGRVALMGVLWICFMELEVPMGKGVKCLMNGESVVLPWPRFIERLIHIPSFDWGPSDTRTSFFIKKKNIILGFVICCFSQMRLALLKMQTTLNLGPMFQEG